MVRYGVGSVRGTTGERISITMSATERGSGISVPATLIVTGMLLDIELKTDFNL